MPLRQTALGEYQHIGICQASRSSPKSLNDEHAASCQRDHCTHQDSGPLLIHLYSSRPKQSQIMTSLPTSPPPLHIFPLINHRAPTHTHTRLTVTNGPQAAPADPATLGRCHLLQYPRPLTLINSNSGVQTPSSKSYHSHGKKKQRGESGRAPTPHSYTACY